jgi:hypothetical protein
MDVRRRATALLAGLALATMELVAPATPAVAAPADSDTLVFVDYRHDTWTLVRNGVTSPASALAVYGDVLAGDFSAAPGTDLFVYNAEGAPDGVLHVEPDGTGVTTSFTPKTVRGHYRPLAGDFDGDGLDDILWYAWGTAPDSIWLFRPDGSHRSVPVTVNGGYVPFVVEATGDGHDDVFWYGLGSAPDSLWIFGAGAGHVSRPMRVDGTYYQPMVGHFRDAPEGSSQEEILWYKRDGTSWVWTFTADGGHTSRSLPGVSNATPVIGDLRGTGRDDIFWYRIGPAPDELTTFEADGLPTRSPAPAVRGAYHPVVGDLDGDGREDIAWTTQGRATVWSLDDTGTGYTQTQVATEATGWQGAVVARTYPADL